jgi:hypothetical protein
MEIPKYQLSADESLSTYQFISEGPRGAITKVIQFSRTNYPDVYNLAFGDLDIESGKIDDRSKSNNSDMEKVLSTVVSAVYAFTDKNPGAWIFAVGSTKSRTKLYQKGIARHFRTAQIDFEIYGMFGGTWVEFEADTNYEAFLVKRKKS